MPLLLPHLRNEIHIELRRRVMIGTVQQEQEFALVGFDCGISGDADLQHLAHLFLGRVHEAEGALAEAGQEYAQALTLAPQSQAAALALSHLRQRQGEPGSLELVEGVLAQAGQRSAPDAYWDYLMARAAPRAEALLDELRQQASR